MKSNRLRAPGGGHISADSSKCCERGASRGSWHPGVAAEARRLNRLGFPARLFSAATLSPGRLAVPQGGPASESASGPPGPPAPAGTAPRASPGDWSPGPPVTGRSVFGLA